MTQLDTNLDATRLFVVLPFKAALAATCHLLDHRSSDHLVHQSELGWLPASSPSARLWKREPLALSSELHPSLNSVLGGAAEGGRSAHAAGAPIYWQLDPAVRDELNKRGSECPPSESDNWGPDAIAAPPGFGIVLRLSKAAQRRLGSLAPPHRVVPLRIVDARFYLSQTRFGQLVFEISCAAPNLTAGLVVEVIHALSHGRNGEVAAKRWEEGLGRLYRQNRLVAQGDFMEPFARLSLLELAKSLVCEGESSPCFLVQDRAFTYTLASTKADLDEPAAGELAARLARRFTADYSPDAALEGVALARPFATVTHACSIEGGAALVSAADKVDFLKDFVKSVGEKIYLTLALLANKEFHDLVALSQGSAMNIEHADRDDEAVLETKLTKLLALQERLLNFRLAHRFSVASFNSNHNLVHRAWRRATGANELLADISGDVRETETLLARVRDQLRARKEKERGEELERRGAVIEAFLTFLATLEGARVLIEIAQDVLEWPSPTVDIAGRLAAAFGTSLPPASPLPWVQIAVQSAPLVIGFVSGLSVWLFARRGSHIEGAHR